MTTARPVADTTAIWNLISTAHTYLSRRVAADFDRDGTISLSTFEILNRIACTERLRPTDLLDSTLLSQPGLSRRIERLELAGLIRRHRDVRDLRASTLSLTDAGRTAYQVGLVVHRASICRHWQTSLTTAEKTQLADLLRRMHAIDA